MTRPTKSSFSLSSCPSEGRQALIGTVFPISDIDISDNVVISDDGKCYKINEKDDVRDTGWRDASPISFFFFFLAD